MKPIKTIIVNGRGKYFDRTHLTHEELCIIAFGPQPRDDVTTITYCKGYAKKPEGSLLPGEDVPLKNNMSFTVVKTNRA